MASLPRSEKAWRIDNASHLKYARLQFLPWRQKREDWDHDHCLACNAKFAEAEGTGILHEGYTTCSDYMRGAEYHWICPTCFTELKPDLGWRDVSRSGFWSSLRSFFKG